LFLYFVHLYHPFLVHDLSLDSGMLLKEEFHHGL
jgi:hypothetical protein